MRECVGVYETCARSESKGWALGPPYGANGRACGRVRAASAGPDEVMRMDLSLSAFGATRKTVIFACAG